MSDNLKRAFSYAAIKVKTNAAAQTSSGHIYDGWLIQVNTPFFSFKKFLFALLKEQNFWTKINWLTVDFIIELAG